MKKRLALLLAIVMLLGALPMMPMNLMAATRPAPIQSPGPFFDVHGAVPQYQSNQIFMDQRMTPGFWPMPMYDALNIWGGGRTNETTPANSRYGIRGVDLVVPFYVPATLDGDDFVMQVVLTNGIWAFHNEIAHELPSPTATPGEIEALPRYANVSDWHFYLDYDEEDPQPTDPTIAGNGRITWMTTRNAIPATAFVSGRLPGAASTDSEAYQVDVQSLTTIQVTVPSVSTGLRFVTIPLVAMGNSNIIATVSGTTQWAVELPNADTPGVGLRTITTISGGALNAARGRVYIPQINITETSPYWLRDGVFALIPPVGFNIHRADGTQNPVPIGAGLQSVQLGVAPNGWDELIAGTQPLTYNLQSVPGVWTLPATWQAVPHTAQLVSIQGLGTNRLFAGVLRIPGGTFVLQAIERFEDPWFGEETQSIVIADYNMLRNVDPTHEARTNAAGADIRPMQLRRVNPGSWPDTWVGNNGGGNPRITTDVSLGLMVQDGWDIDFRRVPDNYAHIWSGRAGQATANVVVDVNTINAWNLTRDTVFTLVDADGRALDKVRLSNVNIPDTATAAVDIRTAGGGNLRNTTFHNRERADFAGSGQPEWYAHALFGREGNTFILRDLAFPHDVVNPLPRLEMNFRLSVHPDFEGPIYLEIGGGGTEDTFNLNRINLSNRRVQIAQAHRPFDVEFDTTVVQIGYLIYEVSDIVITERIVPEITANQGRGLVSGQLRLGVGAFGRTTLRAGAYMGFNPLGRDNVVTSGDDRFRVTDVRMGVDTERGHILVTIAEQGRTPGQAGVIEFRNLSLDIDRTVPEGRYQLVVGGGGVHTNTIAPTAANQLWLFDRFPVDGFTFEEFVIMGTPGAHRPFVREVVVRPDDFVALVNGVEIPMEAPPMFFGDRVYVPIRFISQILGVHPDNVRWDQGLQQVSIMTAERNITFHYQSPFYFVNGIQFSMIWPEVNAWGETEMVQAVPQFPNEEQVWRVPESQFRLYVPIRFIAYALGIEAVDWDGQNVIFNPHNVVASDYLIEYLGEE